MSGGASYDAVIVGARAAGSPLATRLAEQGWKVLLVDREPPPANVLSTHCLFPNTLARLAELGAMERIEAEHRVNLIGYGIRTLGREVSGEFTPIGGFDRAATITRPVLDKALLEVAEAAGAETRFGEKVTGLIGAGTEADPARGVVLESGEEIAARQVISGVDPHRTFLKLVGEKHLDPELARQVKRFKMRGSSGKVNLALDALPEFACLPGEGPHLRGDITIAPSIDYLERAYDDAKYGAFSRKPFMDCVIPSLTDPTVAPPGKHTMSIFVQYAPYNLKEGAADWPNQREAFGDAVIDTLSEYMPNLKSRILHRQVLTPWDLEQVYGLTEGNIFHGELSLEQLAFLRPIAGWSRYRTPIDGLWMCASGTHPGGGIMGAPGALCAKTMLQKRAV
jgi:phytoene dehydrogenase-like protein